MEDVENTTVSSESVKNVFRGTGGNFHTKKEYQELLQGVWDQLVDNKRDFENSAFRHCVESKHLNDLILIFLFSHHQIR